jgi:hypothetical protein
MTSLIDQRCLNHPAREAVVRCPACLRFFCRECVTEHDGRMICASCAAGATPEAAPASSAGRWIAGAGAGFLIAWLIFYYLGVMLARIPSDFFSQI